jgi:tRNA (guanosine-2'-O-)-methyltransferase
VRFGARLRAPSSGLQARVWLEPEAWSLKPIVIVCAVACGPSVQPAKSANVVAKNLLTPPGTSVVQACTPTGPELCFNAIDDNCNGVIDEGCGVQTGLLQFTIAWGESPADVDLSLATPNGERISNATRASPTGFRLDRDCPGGQDECGGQNVENIFFEGIEPPRGHYVVDVKLNELHGAEAPVRVRFGARLGNHSVGFDVALAPGDDAKKTFAFDL